MAPTIFPTDDEIWQAAGILRSGGLVAFPTETVYGLGANALDASAVQKIFAVKQRPATSPLIVHVGSVAMAKELVSEWSGKASRLADRFWPGPLTLVLPKKPVIPDVVTAGLPSVGLRMPAHPVALRLLECAGVPIAAPSANRFTRLSPTEARHVREGGLGPEVECILDGGSTEIGIESTVLSLLEGEGRLLRPGMIAVSDIEEIIGPLSGVLPVSGGSHLSPGLHLQHYSPATKTVIGTDFPPGRVGYVWWNQERKSCASVRMPSEPRAYAQKLYSVLHEMDALRLDAIVVEPVPQEEEWAGIRDRLSRASAELVVDNG